MTNPHPNAIPAVCHQAIRRSAGFLLDDILMLNSSGESEESIALDELPPHYRAQVLKDLPRWCVAFATAASKLAEARPVPPSCVAEQLAMHAILSFATETLVVDAAFGHDDAVGRKRAEDCMQRILDDLCDDQDYLFLYDPALDGIGADPAEPLGQVLRTVNLAYKDWFQPLPGWLGHPFFEGPSPDAGKDDCPWF